MMPFAVGRELRIPLFVLRPDDRKRFSVSIQMPHRAAHWSSGKQKSRAEMLVFVPQIIKFGSEINAVAFKTVNFASPIIDFGQETIDSALDTVSFGFNMIRVELETIIFGVYMIIVKASMTKCLLVLFVGVAFKSETQTVLV